MDNHNNSSVPGDVRATGNGGARIEERRERRDVAQHEDQQEDQQEDQHLLLVAHELKAPITVIKGMVQLAHQRLRAGGHLEEARWLQVADQQINRLTALVDYLLRAGQFDSSPIELHVVPFDLADLVREVGTALQALTTAHTVIVQAPTTIMMEGDVARLEQVLINLVTNAIKYSPEGGGIGITLRCVDEAAEVCVRDQGIGIPVADRSQVFERFQRAGNVGDLPGFGLGLTVSREIVRAHHGRLWVEDPALAIGAAEAPEILAAGNGRGSILCFTLPLRQEVQS